MNITMIEAGYVTHAAPDLVIRLLSDAGRLRLVHKGSEDPQWWTVSAAVLATLPGVRVDWSELRFIDADRRRTQAAIKRDRLRRR